MSCSKHILAEYTGAADTTGKGGLLKSIYIYIYINNGAQLWKKSDYAGVQETRFLKTSIHCKFETLNLDFSYKLPNKH